MPALAVLSLTMQFLTVDTNIDKRGKTTQQERLVYTSQTIGYESMESCNNAKEEWALAVGAYQMSKRPARVIMAVCNNAQTGSVE